MLRMRIACGRCHAVIAGEGARIEVRIGTHPPRRDAVDLCLRCAEAFASWLACEAGRPDVPGSGRAGR